VLLLVIVSVNTIRFSSKQLSPPGEKKNFPEDSAAVRHLSEAIKIKTISYDNESLTDYTAFDSLNSFLKKTYPAVFERLELRIVNNHSLLLKWKSVVTSEKPVIFYAHMDVVPAGDSISTGWKFAPFNGDTDDKFIYGRGAIDDKGSVIALMESVNKLVAENFSPTRDLYFAFGHDEEAGGEKGAKEIAALMEREGVKAEFLLDEGGLVAIDMVPFVKSPVALIFSSEKGYMTLQLTVRSNGGHSGFPPANPPIEILSDAILKIHNNPFDKKITGSVADFMDYTGPEMSFPFKALFANQWLFSSLILSEYEKIPSANAMIRTTSVATVISGGEKENAVPADVHAKINFRLLPGDQSADVVERIIQIVNDKRVEISIVDKPEEASEISGIETEGFNLLMKTVNSVFPDAIVAPSLLIAQTDSRHFTKVTENIYRFQPVRMNDEVLSTMHGRNEKIGIDEFMESIEFYRRLISSL
jgi:carboxypeptidase PM20D1